jgi:gamma-tubulin complex component 3
MSRQNEPADGHGEEQYQEQETMTQCGESGLLRDLPFNLQGLSSSDMQFMSTSTLKLPPTLPLPMVSLLNTLAEPCLLYRGLSAFVESSDGGLVSQSLRAALSNELRSYLGLVATLESEIRRALAAPEESHGSKSGVTLKRCVVWTRDATMALRLMSLIVEEAQSKCIPFLLFRLL